MHPEIQRFRQGMAALRLLPGYAVPALIQLKPQVAEGKLPLPHIGDDQGPEQDGFRLLIPPQRHVRRRPQIQETGPLRQRGRQAVQIGQQFACPVQPQQGLGVFQAEGDQAGQQTERLLIRGDGATLVPLQQGDPRQGPVGPGAFPQGEAVQQAPLRCFPLSRRVQGHAQLVRGRSVLRRG